MVRLTHLTFLKVTIWDTSELSLCRRGREPADCPCFRDRAFTKPWLTLEKETILPMGTGGVLWQCVRADVSPTLRADPYYRILLAMRQLVSLFVLQQLSV